MDPDDGYQEFLAALADGRLGAEELIEAAWRYDRKAGTPYGESRKGLALWLERLTGTTTN